MKYTLLGKSKIETNFYDFINDENNVRVDNETLFLSRIFKWYKSDFGNDIHQYLMQFAIPSLKEMLSSAKQRE